MDTGSREDQSLNTLPPQSLCITLELRLNIHKVLNAHSYQTRRSSDQTCDELHGPQSTHATAVTHSSFEWESQSLNRRLRVSIAPSAPYKFEKSDDCGDRSSTCAGMMSTLNWKLVHSCSLA